MGYLSSIPQGFFDFFARVVPGTIIITLWMLFFDGHQFWRPMLCALAAGMLDQSNVFSFASLAFLGGAYVLGQLAAPFAKATQRFGESLAPMMGCKKVPNRGAYDWLRARHPETGTLPARIRAESTMFYSCAFVFASAAIIHALSRGVYWNQLTKNVFGIFVFFLVLSISSLVRGFTTMNTFSETSRKLRLGKRARY